MTLSDELLNHAIEFLPDIKDAHPGQVKLRRAITAAYYSLFHRINGDAVALLARNVSSAIRYRVQRWFDHGEMKKVCGRFTAPQLSQPLRDLIGPSAPL